MRQDEVAFPKKLVYGVAIGLVLLTAVLLLAWKLYDDRSQRTYVAQVDAGNLKVGQPAPDFTLDTLDGEQVTLSELKGKAVLINFWASWCIPCREEMPELVRSYETHKSEGLVILGLNLTFTDSLPDVQEFADEFGITFPVLLDKDGTVVERIYRIPGLPTSVFVNRDGIIVRVQIGIMTAEMIEPYVEEILK